MFYLPSIYDTLENKDLKYLWVEEDALESLYSLQEKYINAFTFGIQTEEVSVDLRYNSFLKLRRKKMAF